MPPNKAHTGCFATSRTPAKDTGAGEHRDNAPRQLTLGQAGRTAGTLRVLGAGSERLQFPILEPVSPQPPVTQAVGRLVRKAIY